MVKRAKLAAKKARKLLEGEKAAPAPVNEGPRPPQHIQRKLTRKVKFLERVAATKPSRGSVQKRQKKKAPPSAALTDLAALTRSLDEAAAAGGSSKQLGHSVGTQRGRERVAVVEVPRLQQVLAHPQFAANPLAAIASHLAATLPAAPAPALAGPAKDAATLRREKKKRRKERAAAAREMGDD